MKFAQEVRNRRLRKMEEERDCKVDERIYATFCTILGILDDATLISDFHGIQVFAGEDVYKPFRIESDGFYRLDEKLVDYKELVDPIDFQASLKRYVSEEKGYVAEISRYAPCTKVLYINIM